MTITRKRPAPRVGTIYIGCTRDYLELRGYMYSTLLNMCGDRIGRVVGGVALRESEAISVTLHLIRLRAMMAWTLFHVLPLDGVDLTICPCQQATR